MENTYSDFDFKLSVILPCYNDEKYIKDTIDSWLNQSYPIYELIVNDDCSTDNTLAFVKAHYATNNRVQIYRNDVNAGMAGNWNIGIKKATGNYVCNFNADDLVHKDFTAEIVEVFKKYPDLNFVSTNYEDYKAGVSIRPSSNLVRSWLPTGRVNDFPNLHFKSGIIFSLVFTVFKQSFLQHLQNNNKGMLFDLVQTCDAELWTRIGFINAQGYYINKYLGYYRKHDSNISSKPWAEFYSSIKNMRKHKKSYINTFGRRAYISKINRQFIPYFKWHIKRAKFPKKEAVISYFELIF